MQKNECCPDTLHVIDYYIKFMKTLLVFLILLNLTYAAWEILAPQQSYNKVEPLPRGLKSLVLLNDQNLAVEMAKEAAVDSVKTEDLPDGDLTRNVSESASTAQVSDLVDQCFTLGPFKDVSIMRQVQDSIAEYVVDINTRKRVEAEKHRYWVYLTAKDGRAGAKKTGALLREKNINEFYIVLKGASKNSISLGHFKEQSGANRRLKQLVKLGFGAEIKVIYRDYDVYWLDYRLDQAALEDNVDLAEYQSEGVSQIRRECDASSL